MSHPSGIHLSADCLQSKYGFNDGDTPDWLLDYAHDHASEADRDAIYGCDWHEVLRALVRAHLLPALQAHHQIEVYDIDTIHNPIRASSIDGVEVDHYGNAIPTTPAGVDVPLDVVLAAIRDNVAALPS